MKIGKIVLGILSAMGAGAVLGVLFAPDKGSVTRSKLSKKSKELENEFESKINSVTDSVNKKMADLKEDARKMASEIKKKAEVRSEEYKNTEKVNMN